MKTKLIATPTRGTTTVTIKRSAALALTLLLSACATPGQLRQKATDLDEVSSVPAERLAGCVGDKLEVFFGRDGNTRISTRPMTNGFSVEGTGTVGGWGGTDTPVLVDITRQDDGKTHVQAWDNLLSGSGGAALATLVRGCL